MLNWLKVCCQLTNQFLRKKIQDICKENIFLLTSYNLNFVNIYWEKYSKRTKKYIEIIKTLF